MIEQLAHVCINARDLQETRAFYTRILGLELHFEFEKEGRLFGFYLRLGNQTFIEVFQGDPGAGGGIRHLALQVSDLEGFVCRVRARGGEISDPRLGADHSRQAWITDPNGVRIELHEYTDASSQLTGQRCVIA